MSKKLALIVDDSPDWRDDIGELLQKKEFEVMTAEDRATAISLIMTYEFDVAVLDVNLTDEIHNVEGLMINQEIKRRSPKTRVILMSARELTSRELDEIKPSKFLKKSNIYIDLNSYLMDY